jgi:hypothetical protein
VLRPCWLHPGLVDVASRPVADGERDLGRAGGEDARRLDADARAAAGDDGTFAVQIGSIH